MRSCRTHHDISPLISVPGILPILSPSHMPTTNTNLPQNLFVVYFLRTLIQYLDLTLRSFPPAFSPSICCSRPYPTLGKSAGFASNIIIALLVMPTTIFTDVSGAPLALPISGTNASRDSASPPPDAGLLPNGLLSSVGQPFLDACNLTFCLPGDGQASWVPQVE